MCHGKNTHGVSSCNKEHQIGEATEGKPSNPPTFVEIAIDLLADFSKFNSQVNNSTQLFLKGEGYLHGRLSCVPHPSVLGLIKCLRMKLKNAQF